MEANKQTASPAAVAIASFLVPGLGYWVLGQRRRAVLTGGGVLALFVMGVLIAGVRVISVPGYDEGYLKYAEFRRRPDAENQAYVYPSTQPFVSVKPAGLNASGVMVYTVTRETREGLREEQTTDPPLDQKLLLLQSPISVIGDNLWFLGQMLMGPACAVAGYCSIHAAQAGVDRSYARLADVGALYTAVAGMLNLLVIIDSTSRAAHGGKKERR